jgi:hypothetical protein
MVSFNLGMRVTGISVKDEDRRPVSARKPEAAKGSSTAVPAPHSAQLALKLIS